MAGEDRSSVSLANPAVQSCWLCGTRLPAREMVSDGGSACPDLRWYCADTRRCTERWTSRWSTGAGAGNGRAAHSHAGQAQASQEHSSILGQGRGAVPDSRGRQLAGLHDR
jgi:hypothetical protein